VGGTRVLRALLLAALVPPTWPELFGHDVPAPFGLPRFAVIMVAASTLVTIIEPHTHWPISRKRTIARALRWALAVAALAVAVDTIVWLRATAFYSAQTIADVMAVLLVVHVLGTLVGHVATNGHARETDLRGPVDAAAAAARRWRRPRMLHSTADLADQLDALVAGLVVAFWTLASIAMYEVAGVLLIAGGVLTLLTIPARLARAWRDEGDGLRIRARWHAGLTRWRRRSGSV
jgi:hypothetical protein